mgnify:FL=1
MRHRTRVAILLGILVAVACSGNQQTASQQTATSSGTSGGRAGGTLIYAAESEPDIVNPALTEPNIPSGMIFRGLTRHDQNNHVQPDLARSWQISPDMLTYTFKLRDNVTWHDGTPFTAADVKFTIDFILDKASNSTNRQDFELVQGVDVVDTQTVTIKLSQPFAPLLDKLTIGIIPKHLLQDKDPAKAEFNQKPVGNGPYKFVEWRKGEFMTLEAYDRFYNGRPKIDKIVIKFVPDASQRLLQLKSGEVDAAFLKPKQVEQFKNSEKVDLYIWPTADYRVVMFNFKNSLFQDPRVRTALNYAIDRDALVRSVLVGYGEPAYGPLQKSEYNNPDVTKFTYDPARVKSLMTEAGWTQGADGIWQKDGRRFSVTLTAPATDPVRVDIANVVATSLRANGIDIKVDPRDWAYIRQNWGKLDLFVLGWGSPFDPDDHTFKIFHSSQVLDKGGYNLGSYVNAKVDRLLEQGRITLDENQRKQIYREFQKELNADPPYIWGVYLQAIYGVSKKFQGPKQRLLGHHGSGFFWNVEEWSLK